MRIINGKPAASRIAPLLIVTIALVAVLGRASYPSQSTATATANATGNLLVLWGDPYLPAKTALATGDESLTVQGPVIATGPPGYYEYPYPSITGTLHVQWTTSEGNYSIDASFYQSDDPYNRTTIFPAANTFATSYMYYEGDINVNGVVTHQDEGLAALLAYAPGYFSYHGTSPANMIILYSPSYHADQYVFRWSQTSQVIDGIDQPAATSISQAVQFTETG